MTVLQNQVAKVRAYYAQSDRDFLRYWSGKKALALHFGYCDSNNDKHEASLLRMNEVLASLVDISSEANVLDAGCGYGGTALWLAENRKCAVTGVNVVASHIERARRSALRSSDSKRVAFVEADYTDLPFEDGQFSVVWGLESIVHCADRPQFMKEAFRSLKPGGALLISEYMLVDGHERTDVQQLRLRRFLDGWAMPAIVSAREYSQMAQAAGFLAPVFYDLSEKVAPSLRRCRRNALFVKWLVNPLTKLGVITPIRRDFTLANIDVSDLFDEGVWRYKAMVARKPR